MVGLIDPAILAKIQDLELAGRLIAQGYLFGRHAGLRLGRGIEFAQYRAWQAGEDMRAIDWRMFARSERAYVREAELATDFRLWLLLDYSASMRQRSRTATLSKFAYARFLAAALGYLAQRQGDPIGLIGVGEENRVLLPAEAGRQQWYRLLAQLQGLQARGRNGPLDTLPSNLLAATEAGLVIAISDFYQDESEWVGLLTKLATGNREVVALCLETNDEIDFDYRGARRFVDLESGDAIVTQPAQVRLAYRQARETYLSDIAKALVRSDIGFMRFNVDEPIDVALRLFLQRRMGV